MKIVLFGASGTIGRAILAEALKRKHEVTAAVRRPEALEVQHNGLLTLPADLLRPEEVASAASGHEAAISAYGPAFGAEGELLEVARSLTEGLKKAGVSRLIVVGGAGSLKNDEGERLMDTADFPEEIRPLAAAHADAFEIYTRSGLEYTYASPAAVISPGRRTGQFRIGLDRLVVDENGRSEISTEDYAAAIIDELEEGNFIGACFTVGY
ncbi:NAD(P)H-binding protein [Paenibacillus sp. HN-1]|uniref:NAD(P)-dependent oxidoreductase n=1 Tax=Paenibacillus TaxID=44249 RepID=UPI001CA8AD79|nr:MULTISPECIES: NAD(P)H-binding protein [Paenibacillus]MBY9080019.1 NAD(P)H-binding protein [Paenibacillus sp. CGMCC 1.18879]MBY9086717.1 NAD(P)H-binding protein [Paenibacillus sinensis]